MVNDLLLLVPSMDTLHDMVNDLLLLVQSIVCLDHMVNDLLLLPPNVHQALTVFIIWSYGFIIWL